MPDRPKVRDDMVAGRGSGTTRRQVVIGGGALLSGVGLLSSAAVADVRPPTAELHVVGVTHDGRLWHAIRLANGSWTAFGDVEGQTGDRGLFEDAACALGASGLHVLGVTTDGRLWHAIRQPNGSWTAFGDVESQTGDRGLFRSVSAIVIGADELHVLAVTTEGGLWHAIRFPAGNWTGFGDVEGQTGDRGLVRAAAAG